jgi:hypothetical protein
MRDADRRDRAPASYQAMPIGSTAPIAIMRRWGNRGDHRFERWGVGVAQFETELAAPRVKMRGHTRELGIIV